MMSQVPKGNLRICWSAAQYSGSGPKKCLALGCVLRVLLYRKCHRGDGRMLGGCLTHGQEDMSLRCGVKRHPGDLRSPVATEHAGQNGHGLAGFNQLQVCLQVSRRVPDVWFKACDATLLQCPVT